MPRFAMLFTCAIPLFTWACTATNTHLDGGAMVYRKASAASVEVLVAGRLTGSGWLAHKDGLVVTAAHAVWKLGDKPIDVRSLTLGRIRAKLIAVDRGHDIALLKLIGRKGPFPYLKIADRAPAPGADVYLFGAALFRHELMIRGAMARKKSTFEYLGNQKTYIRIYHIGAPSPPGTSGGCWLDSQGRVIGNQSAFMSRDGVGLGVAMVAPTDAIARLVRTRKSASTPTADTAFEELWSQSQAFIKRFPAGITGVVPVLTVKGGVADKAGLKGDILITGIDAHKIIDRDRFMSYLRTKRPGDEVTFKVMSPEKHESRNIKIKLGELESR
jgi:S1-C subfamily serine protease